MSEANKDEILGKLYDVGKDVGRQLQYEIQRAGNCEHWLNHNSQCGSWCAAKWEDCPLSTRENGVAEQPCPPSEDGD